MKNEQENEEVLNINTFGTIGFAKAVIPQMKIQTGKNNQHYFTGRFLCQSQKKYLCGIKICANGFYQSSRRGISRVRNWRDGNLSR